MSAISSEPGSHVVCAPSQEAAATPIGTDRRPRRDGSPAVARPRSRSNAISRLLPGIGRSRRGVVALEFAIVATPLMLMIFGFIAASSMFYTWSAMQGSAQYAAMLVSTGQIKNLTTGAITTSNTTATANCSGSLTTTEAEYYACSGLPSWATFSVTTTENCATPSVTVTLSANAEAAAIIDAFSFFAGKTLVATAVVMKQNQCP